MSATTSTNLLLLPPPNCAKCRIRLHEMKDGDGNVIPNSYKCGICEAKYPPNLTLEQEKLRRSEEDLRRWSRPSPTAPETHTNCPYCGHDRAAYNTFSNNKGEDWYVYQCSNCHETWKD